MRSLYVYEKSLCIYDKPICIYEKSQIRIYEKSHMDICIYEKSICIYEKSQMDNRCLVIKCCHIKTGQKTLVYFVPLKQRT